jgi:hypothetical protein
VYTLQHASAICALGKSADRIPVDSRFVCAMPARRNIQSRGNPLAAWLFLVGHNTWFGFAHGLTANWMYDAQLAFLAFVLLTIRPALRHPQIRG